MTKSEWVRCPVCGSKTRNRIREDTVLKNYPLFSQVQKEMIINAEHLQVSVLKEEQECTQAVVTKKQNY